MLYEYTSVGYIHQCGTPNLFTSLDDLYGNVCTGCRFGVLKESEIQEYLYTRKESSPGVVTRSNEDNANINPTITNITITPPNGRLGSITVLLNTE